MVALADITDSAQLDRAFDELSGSGLPLDGLLHAIAHAPKAALGPELTSVSNADFHSTFDVSVYSLIELTRRCSPLMPAGGSITALTFQGSQQVFAPTTFAIVMMLLLGVFSLLPPLQ